MDRKGVLTKSTPKKISHEEKKINFTADVIKEAIEFETVKEYNKQQSEEWNICAPDFGWKINECISKVDNVTLENLKERIGKFYLQIWKSKVQIERYFIDGSYNENIEKINKEKDFIIKAIDKFYDDVLSVYD